MKSFVATSLAIGGAALAMAIMAGPANAASFNCARASLPVEMAICNSPGLGELDQEMAQRYFRLTNYAPGWAVRQIKGEQTNWIARRNACGYDNGCVARAYERRIDKLRGWQAQFGL
ncbi:hypothetical protein C3941_06555 [Kaistia algarum]|uniref:lysozyme inhibitor LprI family protein n=1 Tax=Kaistia algarum TaxID=2083279 RepID=UPI000CE7FB96|nr:lysozyme inhibitor LprI family protein [Kaistia algarum]MCX5515665.1 hypothetical protein [Kaistia algarum]PPE80951.1 hypothetical protein C3941_06555 [Kaistia algarum]